MMEMDLENRKIPVAAGLLGLIILALVAVRLPMAAAAYNTSIGVQPIEAQNITVTDIEQTEDSIAFNLNLTVENPNFFPARIDRITYTVYLADEKLGNGDIRGKTLSGNSRADLIDRFEVNGSEAVDAGISSFAAYLTGETVYLRVEGDMHIGAAPLEVKVPFERRRPIN
jgi:LEA14-like dessication related protein